jgi:hypothetical protein
VTRPMAPGPVPGTARGPKCQDHKSHDQCLAPHTARNAVANTADADAAWWISEADAWNARPGAM